MEPVCTIAPPRPAAFMAFAAACAMKNLPLRMMFRKRSYSSSVTSKNGFGPKMAGVVEQDVQTAKAIERCLYRCFSCRRQGNVAHMGDSALSGRVDLLGSGLSFGGIASDDNDRTVFRDESGRHFLADA